MHKLHGFTGSGQVFKRNTAALSANHHVIVPDLRGHGESEKPRAGYHVARLALDLRNLIEHLALPSGRISAVGTSLGAAIIWCVSPNFQTIRERRADNTQVVQRALHSGDLLTRRLCRPSPAAKLPVGLGSRVWKPWVQRPRGVGCDATRA